MDKPVSQTTPCDIPADWLAAWELAKDVALPEGKPPLREFLSIMGWDLRQLQAVTRRYEDKDGNRVGPFVAALEMGVATDV